MSVFYMKTKPFLSTIPYCFIITSYANLKEEQWECEIMDTSCFLLLLLGCMEEESTEQTNGEQEETATEGMQEDEITREEDPKNIQRKTSISGSRTLTY